MKIRIPLLLIAFTAQLLVPAWTIYDQEQIRSHGQEFRFRAEPVDPYDAFRGRYVRIGFSDNTAPYYNEKKPERDQLLYAHIQTDENNLSSIKEVTIGPPANNAPYLRVKYNWLQRKEMGNIISPENKSEEEFTPLAHFAFPMNRFYMEESIAPAAEKAYRDARRNTGHETTVTIRILNGKAVLTGLYIDDQPIADYVRSLPLNAQ
mgnify:CR=1 FL=1